MAIKDYESAVRSCFGEDDIENLWYGETEGKIGDEPNKMYIAITEDDNWFFDYEKFKTLPLHIDGVKCGVYVVWMKGTALPSSYTRSLCPRCETNQPAVEFKTDPDLRNGDVMVCENCYNDICEEEEAERKDKEK